MSFESLIYSRDDSKIKVVAGDIAEGYWELTGSTLRHVQFSPKLEHQSINMADSIKRLDLKDAIKKDSSEPLVGAGIGALIGIRFGLVGLACGAAAGWFFTSGRNEISVICELKDGRQFIAVMTPQQYERLHVYAPKRSFAG